MDFLGFALCLGLGGVGGFMAASARWFKKLDKMDQLNDWLASEAAAWHHRYDEATALVKELMATQTRPSTAIDASGEITR